MTIKLTDGVAVARRTSRFIRIGTITSGLLGSLLISGSISAASACKGLDSDACGASASCGWVESYQRKDGRTVKAFCRTKSTRKAKASEVSSSASSKQESSIEVNGTKS